MDRNNIINVNSVPTGIVSIDSLGRLVMDDRIRLAEAMGWELLDISNSPYPILQWQRTDGQLVADFDPFTDANDDYAVLEWMRSAKTKKPFTCGHEARDYKIGDYARDALKVLE